MKTYQHVIVAAIPTVAALVLLPSVWVVLSFIVLGQGHFFITYLYQYRSGKMNVAYGVRYGIAVLLVFAFLFLTNWSLMALIFAAAVIFEAHFVLDELHLAKVKMEPLLLLAVLPILFMYPVALSDRLFGTSLSNVSIVAAVSCSVLYIVGLAWRRRISYGGLWMVFLAMLFLATVTLFDVSVEKLVGSIILYHYFRWLIFYADKYWNTPRFVPYLRDVLWTHGLAAMLFVWYWFVPGTGRTVLALFFAQLSFYAWTCLHIFSSARIGGVEARISDAGKFIFNILDSNSVR